jgi:hypothetical protein
MRSNAAFRALLALLMTACPTAALAEPAAAPREKHPGDRSGLGVGVGFGPLFAGVGAQLVYYEELSEGFFIVPALAYGIAGTDVDGFYTGLAAGVMAMLGRDDHWVASTSIGSIGAGSRITREERRGSLGFAGPADTSTYASAVSLELGYEWMREDGGLFRLLLGAMWIPDPSFETRVFPIFTLAGGWKS